MKIGGAITPVCRRLFLFISPLLFIRLTKPDYIISIRIKKQ